MQEDNQMKKQNETKHPKNKPNPTSSNKGQKRQNEKCTAN
jgi:hypothetical protein